MTDTDKINTYQKVTGFPDMSADERLQWACAMADSFEEMYKTALGTINTANQTMAQLVAERDSANSDVNETNAELLSLQKLLNEKIAELNALKK